MTGETKVLRHTSRSCRVRCLELSVSLPFFSLLVARDANLDRAYVSPDASGGAIGRIRFFVSPPSLKRSLFGG